MNSTTTKQEKVFSNRVAPILSPLPQQLPYPYQTRKVNFNSYSGTKRDTSVKGYDPADIRSKSFTMPNASHSQSVQRLKSAPANPQRHVDTFENNELDLSTDGFEVFVDDQQSRPQTQSGRSRDLSFGGSDIIGSENLMWLLDVAEKNSRKESARSSSPPRRTTSATVPDPDIVERSHNQERLEGPTLRSAPNQRTSVVSSIDYSKTSSKPKSAMASKADRKELITSKSMPVFSRGESLDSEPLLVAPRTIVDEILDDWQQQPFHKQYSIKTIQKTQKLKGVTQEFDEESSTSPYLEHLTTSNPRLGNAATALHKMHAASLETHRRGSTTVVAGISTPKGFAIVQNENTAIDPDFDKLSRPVPEPKYSNHQLQPHLSGKNILPSASSKGLRPTTAQEKVAMFKSTIPDHRPVSVNARAIHSQQGSWSAKGLQRMQRTAGNTNLMNTVPSDSLTQDLTGNIDRLISSIQFPSQPIANTVPTTTQEALLMEATTVELPFVDTLDISLTTSDQLAVLHNIHRDPLYRLLREECEAVKTEALAAQAKEARLKTLQSIPGPTLDSLGNLDKPQANRSHHNISSSELKVLRSFKALPPAVWITARIVYFLILSYYECFLVPAKNQDGSPSSQYRHALNMEKFWSVLEHQVTQDHMQLSTVMHLYSWPYLHALLSHPVQFIKSLSIIEHGALSKDRNLFFEAFPLEKLEFLRQLVQQGQGLFQETAVITSVPVCAKLCSWAKRVIANIYSSCLARIRLQQHLESTVPEEYIDDMAGGGLDMNTSLEGPTESLEVSAAAPETGDFTNDFAGIGETPGDRPMSRLRVAPSKLANSIHIVAAIQSTFANIAVDQPFDMNAFQCAISLTKPMDTLNVILSDGNTKSEFMDYEEYRIYYEDCLRKYYTSPFHNVQLLSVAQSQSTNEVTQHGSPSHKIPVVSYKDTTLLTSSSAVSVASSHSPSHTSSSQNLRVTPTAMQAEANHADLELNSLVLYGVTSAAEILITSQSNNGQYPSLITRTQKNSNSTDDVQYEYHRQKAARKFLQSGRLHFKFSLALASNDCSLLSGDQPETTASLTNNYVVCIKNTKNSWAAFQLVCRLSKPADIITVIHIPEIEIPIEERSSLTAEKYEQHKAKTIKRISQLAGLYKTAGFNLYVDDIPDFVDEAQRSMSNYFQKTAMESRYRQMEKNLTVDGELARDQFVHNQYKFNLVNRLLTVASMFKPTFIIMGSDSVDVSLAMSSAHKNPLNSVFPCKYDVDFTPDPTQLITTITTPSEVVMMTPDDNDSTGFIYNDNTSFTFESLGGESQLDSPSRLNRTIEAETAMYEGDDDMYENDSFVIDDNNTYGADSFEGEESNPYSSTFERNPSQLSQKSSIDAKSKTKSSVKSAADIAAQNKLNFNKELELLDNYLSYSQYKVGMVEMLLHVNNTVNESKDLSTSAACSIILANHVKARK